MSLCIRGQNGNTHDAGLEVSSADRVDRAIAAAIPGSNIHKADAAKPAAHKDVRLLYAAFQILEAFMLPGIMAQALLQAESLSSKPSLAANQHAHQFWGVTRTCYCLDTQLEICRPRWMKISHNTVFWGCICNTISHAGQGWTAPPDPPRAEPLARAG